VLQSGEIVRLGLFVVVSVLAVLLSAARKRTLARLQQLLDDQQTTIRQLQEQNDRLRVENAQRREDATIARAAEQEIRQTVDTVPALIARYRADGFMDFRNRNWREYTGLSQDNAEGRRWGSALHPDDEEMVEREWREHISTGAPFELEQRLRKADGEYRWHRVRRVPLHDETGAVIKWYAIAFDIDDRKRTEDALRKTAIDRLGMEARAGNLINGADRVEAAARAGKVHLLIHALDASEDGRRRMDQAWRVGGGEARGVIFPEERTILSMALGRENVVHVALTDPAAASRVRHALARWRAFTDPNQGLEGGAPASRSGSADDLTKE